MLDRTPPSPLHRARPRACHLAMVALALGLTFSVSAGTTQALAEPSAMALRDAAARAAADAAALRADIVQLAQAQLAQAPASAENEALASFAVRLNQLETELRRITGQIEESAFMAGRAMRDGERMQREMEGRLGALEERLRRLESGKGGGAAQAPAAAGGEAAQGPAGGGPPQAAALPEGGPKEQYDFAFGLLRQADYPNAERALRQFLQANPNHELAGNAKFWLGETFFVRSDFRQAATEFAEGYQKYPKSQKAPEMLLKLGMSLNQLGERQKACQTFEIMDAQYPRMTGSLKLFADRAKQQARCQ